VLRLLRALVLMLWGVVERCGGAPTQEGVTRTRAATVHAYWGPWPEGGASHSSRAPRGQHARTCRAPLSNDAGPAVVATLLFCLCSFGCCSASCGLDCAAPMMMGMAGAQ
jgi:hypothetical protein